LKTTQERDIYLTIPPGRKENVYFVVNNERNRTRMDAGQKCEYSDDCGAWVSCKGACPISYYIRAGSSGVLKNLIKKNGLFCVEKKINKQRHYIPVNPQPEEGEIMELRRMYSTLKVGTSFRRRVSFIKKWPTSESTSTSKSLIIVEYTGMFPGRNAHGNSNHDADYVRVAPHTMDNIKKMVEHNPIQCIQGLAA
jgi:hypothetical protein